MARRAMWPTGGRNWMAPCRAPGWMCRRCLREPPRNLCRVGLLACRFERIMSENTIHSVGIVMNGVTGRMGLNQHLRRSIHAIMQQGGVPTADGEIIMPRPLLAGRNAVKLEAIAREFGGIPFTTDLDGALKDPAYFVFNDAPTTERRAAAIRKAIAAGKDIYCEKPTAESFEAAYDLYR